MGRPYSGIANYLLCCCISILLLLPSKRRILSGFAVFAIAITVLFIGVLIPTPVALGWEGIKAALSVTVHSTFSTSFGAIARDIAIFLYVIIRRWRAGGRKEMKKYVQSVLDLIVATVAAFVLVSVYHLLVTVPKDQRKSMKTTLTPTWEMASKLQDEHRPKKPEASHKTPSYPRLTSGPEAYKNLTPQQVADWALAESDVLADLTSKYQQRAKTRDNGTTLMTVQHFFQEEFEKCCWPALRDIRSEVLARLGPAGIDADEHEMWDRSFPDQDKFYFFQQLDMNEVERYAPLLRRIAIDLERTYVPRPAPRELRSTESIMPSGDKNFPYKTVAVVTTGVERKHGYVVTFFSEGPMMAECNVGRSHIMAYGVEVAHNRDLSTIVDDLSTPKCVVWIGSIAFSPKAPMRVVLVGKNPIHVARAQYIPE
jgi:hypothetical protein